MLAHRCPSQCCRHRCLFHCLLHCLHHRLLHRLHHRLPSRLCSAHPSSGRPQKANPQCNMSCRRRWSFRRCSRPRKWPGRHQRYPLTSGSPYLLRRARSSPPALSSWSSSPFGGPWPPKKACKLSYPPTRPSPRARRQKCRQCNSNHPGKGHLPCCRRRQEPQ